MKVRFTLLAILAATGIVGCDAPSFTIRFSSERWLPKDLKWYASLYEADSSQYNILTDTTRIKMRRHDGYCDTCTFLFALDTVLVFYGDGVFQMDEMIVEANLSRGSIEFGEALTEPGHLQGSWKDRGTELSIKYERIHFTAIDGPIQTVPGSKRKENATLVLDGRIVRQVIYHGRVFVPVDSVAIDWFRRTPQTTPGLNNPSLRSN